MAVSNITSDYTGRLLDIDLSNNPNPIINTPQLIKYSFSSPVRYVAGVQKLIQRYLIAMINAGFISQIAQMNNSNIQEAIHTFNILNFQVIQDFRAYQKSNPTIPNDEQLAGVQLSTASVATDPSTATNTQLQTLNFTLTLVTAAGTNVPFVLPLPLN